MQRREVLNINRGTRIKAGMNLSDIMSYFLSLITIFFVTTIFIPSLVLRVPVVLGLFYAYLKTNGWVRTTYGPGFLGDYVQWTLTPDVYAPSEDPEPIALVAPKNGR